jgi:ABC-type dipeptide/oligopeptide/nickel transport system ATPase component
MNGLSSGWIIGKWFIGYLEDSNKLYILMSINQYNKIFNYCQEQELTINFLERDGTYYNIFYNDRKIKISDLEPRFNQEKLINKMIETIYINKHKSCISLITGPPGTGKSYIAHLLCKKLISQGATTVNLIDTHNPSDPGDFFASLYSRVEPTEKSPLVVVFEEIDILIEKIMNNFQSHKLIPIAIQNKSGWNCYFDRFNRGIYPHVYIIMTSNKNQKWFNHKCPSLIREGRIDINESLYINDNTDNIIYNWPYIFSKNLHNY